MINDVEKRAAPWAGHLNGCLAGNEMKVQTYTFWRFIKTPVGGRNNRDA
jgi:hypothetical protein